MQLAFCGHLYTDAGRWEAVGNDVSWEGGDLWVLEANSTRQKLGFATVTHKLQNLGLRPAYTATHREPREGPLGMRDTLFHTVPQGPRLMASRVCWRARLFHPSAPEWLMTFLFTTIDQNIRVAPPTSRVWEIHIYE